MKNSNRPGYDFEQQTAPSLNGGIFLDCLNFLGRDRERPVEKEIVTWVTLSLMSQRNLPQSFLEVVVLKYFLEEPRMIEKNI